MDDVMRVAAERAARYLADLDERRVAPAPEALERLAAFDGPLPEAAGDAVEVIRALDDLGSPATVATAGPRYFGFVIGGSLPVTVAANWLAAAWDQNAGVHRRVAGRREAGGRGRALARSSCSVCPSDAVAAFVTGATMANFSALAAARHAVLARAGWDVEADGLFGAPSVTVALGEEAHPSVRKALGVLGLGRTRVLEVPVDGQGRMRDGRPAQAVRARHRVPPGRQREHRRLRSLPGARELGVTRRAPGCTWTAPSACGRRRRRRGPGCSPAPSTADSWATDAHKWLNVPYDSGVAFVRDHEALRAAMAVTAAYLPIGERSRARGLHARAVAARRVASRYGRRCAPWAAPAWPTWSSATAATRSASPTGCSRAGYEILNDVVLNQVLVAFGDEDTTRRVIAAVQDDGTCWCGGTVWQGRTAMRISVSSWATTESDVERSLEAMIRCAREVRRGAVV